MRNIRNALLKLASQEPAIRGVVLPITRQAEKWEGMPKGWDADSRKKFWETLTGDNKHKVTKCIKEMSKGDKGIDDPGAFCAALADRVLGPGWRKGKRAGLFQWKSDPSPWSSALTALMPDGSRYKIREDGGYLTYWSKENHGTSPDGYVKANGNLNRRPSLTANYESLQDAEKAAAAHWALVNKKPETDPQVIAKSLSRTEKEFLTRVHQEGFEEAYPDFGTNSERPMRVFRTRMLNQMWDKGLMHKRLVSLSPLGKQVVEVLQGRSKKAAQWAQEQDETEAHLSPKGDKLFDDFANGKKVNMTQLRKELEKAAVAAGHGHMSTELARLMIDGVMPQKKQASSWKLLEGAGLEKVKRIFRTPSELSVWYVLDRKILGKSVFLRDHGTKTLYVVGVDGHAYSLQTWSMSVPMADLQTLVETAMSGELPPPRSGIYRNMKVKKATLTPPKHINQTAAQELTPNTVDGAAARFRDHLELKMNEQFRVAHPSEIPPTLSLIHGNDLIRVVKANGGLQREAVAFIARATGNVYRAANWDRPHPFVIANVLDSGSWRSMRLGFDRHALDLDQIKSLFRARGQ